MVYDSASRCWCQLNVDIVVRDDGRMCAVIAREVSGHYRRTGEPTSFNTIDYRLGDGSAKTRSQPGRLFERQLRPAMGYGDGPADRLSAGPFARLRRKTYLGHCVNRCAWRGVNCAFKRVKSDRDVAKYERDIRARETLMDDMEEEEDAAASADDHNREMLAQFRVVPIIAVARGDKDSPWGGGISGFLMRRAGRSLDRVAAPVAVAEAQLASLARGAGEVARCGVMQGDMKHWNVLLQEEEEPEEPATGPGPETPPASGGDGDGQVGLPLIDFGSGAVGGYVNDAHGLGDVFLRLLERSPRLGAEPGARGRVKEAARVLKEEADFDHAVEILGPSSSAS